MNTVIQVENDIEIMLINTFIFYIPKEKEQYLELYG